MGEKPRIKKTRTGFYECRSKLPSWQLIGFGRTPFEAYASFQCVLASFKAQKRPLS